MDARANGRVTIESPLGADATFHSMGGVEGVSQLFVYEIDLLSPKADFHADDCLGHTVTVHLARADGSDDARQWNGCVTGFEYVGTGDDGSSRYRLTIRPWLFYLTENADCRIFQNMSVPDIVMRVFRDRGFTAFDVILQETYPQREYVVQYRESDFNFVSRLMEREGIYYFFRHEAGSHTLVLTDSAHTPAPAPGAEHLSFAPPDAHRDETMEYVGRWRALGTIETSRASLTDYDFTRPRLQLYSMRDAPEPGAAPRLEVYDYPGGYLSPVEGDSYAQLRVEQRRSGSPGFLGETNARGLSVGSTFTLSDHPRDDLNASYLVVSARYRLTDPELRSSNADTESTPYTSSFRAIPSSVTFRPPATARPGLVRGPQTAIVVGPAGQEIWTDQYGRVKVQFHWDRVGRNDENSSCFVRVTQAWAGSGWGAQFIPRIGQEVIIDFLEGDPDRPIITGTVYNGANQVPFELPLNQTQSGIRTRSTPGGTQVNCNEIRFEDSIGNEDLYVQAERTQTTLVKNDQNITIGGSRSKTVAGNETIRVVGGRNATVTLDDVTNVLGLQMLTVAGARKVEIVGDQTHTVQGNRSDVVAGTASLEVAGDLTQNVTGRVDQTTEGVHSENFVDDFVARHTGHRTIVVGTPEANASLSTHVEGSASEFVSELLDIVAVKGIRIRCGKSEITLTPEVVTITSPTISLVGGPSIGLAADDVNIAGGSSVEVGGPKVAVTSSGASVTLDSNATVQGAQVALKGGSGASNSADPDKKKITTIKLVDKEGNPLANQRVIVRTGGEGGDEQAMTLDEKGTLELDGDGPYDVIVPDLPDAQSS
jgi:type VI secretion system secreted protein VgrG